MPRLREMSLQRSIYKDMWRRTLQDFYMYRAGLLLYDVLSVILQQPPLSVFLVTIIACCFDTSAFTLYPVLSYVNPLSRINSVNIGNLRIQSNQVCYSRLLSGGNQSKGITGLHHICVAGNAANTP